MEVTRNFSLLFLFLFNITSLAQVDTAWVRRYNGPGNGDDIPGGLLFSHPTYPLAVDDSGNVYVAGSTVGNGTSLDFTTIKYNSNGDTLWVRRYNGPANGDDEARALAVDNSGYVYVTGNCTGAAEEDYCTIKYAPNGDSVWVKFYNGAGNGRDVGRALALDKNGNVCVTGSSIGTYFPDYNYVTIKYNPEGDTLWERPYYGPANDVEFVRDIGVDTGGNVYVTGLSVRNDTTVDIATVKYAPNGDGLWSRRYNGLGEGGSADGISLAPDKEGNLYVTGWTWNGTSLDATIIKYASNGDTLWIRNYDGPANSHDETGALAVDDSGNVYVAGSSLAFGTGYDYVTIKYAPTGDTLWVRRYHGGYGIDSAFALGLDLNGNVYVAGRSDGSNFYPDYATVKYAPDGTQLWVKRYNGPANNFDRATALAVDTSGNLYVTGTSVGSGTGYDFATIKYIQFICSAKPGDANGDDNILLSDIVTLINFLFKSQPAPNPVCRGDATADGKVLLSDIVYLVNFLFKSGSAPLKNRECCL